MCLLQFEKTDNSVHRAQAQSVGSKLSKVNVCDYKKASFSWGQWEEVEPSHRRKVAAQEMM